MEAYRTAYVYVRDTFAGVLKETDSGYSFIYDGDYLASEDPYNKYPPHIELFPVQYAGDFSFAHSHDECGRYGFLAKGANNGQKNHQKGANNSEKKL